MNWWSDKRVLVTGAHGFLGKHVMAALNERNPWRTFYPRHDPWDLRLQGHVEELYDQWKPHIVIHLAAHCGGIGANQATPGEFLYDNLMMNTLMLDAARRYNVQKFVGLGSVCAYPKYTPIPFKESDIWNGYPEETNAGYGLAKRMLLAQSEAYRQQYGLNAIHLIPANLYGPGDNTDLETSHAIPAMVRKFKEAVSNGSETVTLWGTGEPTREFLHVRDCARAIVLAAEHYDGADPINIGAGKEIAINALALKIANLAGFKGKIRWDDSRPDGQPRRCLDISRAMEFGFEAQISLKDGLAELIESAVFA